LIGFRFEEEESDLSEKWGRRKGEREGGRGEGEEILVSARVALFACCSIS